MDEANAQAITVERFVSFIIEILTKEAIPFELYNGETNLLQIIYRYLYSKKYLKLKPEQALQTVRSNFSDQMFLAKVNSIIPSHQEIIRLFYNNGYRPDIYTDEKSIPFTVKTLEPKLKEIMEEVTPNYIFNFNSFSGVILYLFSVILSFLKNVPKIERMQVDQIGGSFDLDRRLSDLERRRRADIVDRSTDDSLIIEKLNHLSEQIEKNEKQKSQKCGSIDTSQILEFIKKNIPISRKENIELENSDSEREEGKEEDEENNRVQDGDVSLVLTNIENKLDALKDSLESISSPQCTPIDTEKIVEYLKKNYSKDESALKTSIDEIKRELSALSSRTTPASLPTINTDTIIQTITPYLKREKNEREREPLNNFSDDPIPMLTIVMEEVSKIHSELTVFKSENQPISTEKMIEMIDYQVKKCSKSISVLDSNVIHNIFEKINQFESSFTLMSNKLASVSKIQHVEDIERYLFKKHSEILEALNRVELLCLEIKRENLLDREEVGTLKDDSESELLEDLESNIFDKDIALIQSSVQNSHLMLNNQRILNLLAAVLYLQERVGEEIPFLDKSVIDQYISDQEKSNMTKNEFINKYVTSELNVQIEQIIKQFSFEKEEIARRFTFQNPTINFMLMKRIEKILNDLNVVTQLNNRFPKIILKLKNEFLLSKDVKEIEKLIQLIENEKGARKDVRDDVQFLDDLLKQLDVTQIEKDAQANELLREEFIQFRPIDHDLTELSVIFSIFKNATIDLLSNGNNINLIINQTSTFPKLQMFLLKLYKKIILKSETNFDELNEFIKSGVYSNAETNFVATQLFNFLSTNQNMTSKNIIEFIVFLLFNVPKLLLKVCATIIPPHLAFSSSSTTLKKVADEMLTLAVQISIPSKKIFEQLENAAEMSLNIIDAYISNSLTDSFLFLKIEKIVTTMRNGFHNTKSHLQEGNICAALVNSVQSEMNNIPQSFFAEEDLLLLLKNYVTQTYNANVMIDCSNLEHLLFAQSLVLISKFSINSRIEPFRILCEELEENISLLIPDVSFGEQFHNIVSNLIIIGSHHENSADNSIDVQLSSQVIKSVHANVKGLRSLIEKMKNENSLENIEISNKLVSFEHLMEKMKIHLNEKIVENEKISIERDEALRENNLIRSEIVTLKEIESSYKDLQIQYKTLLNEKGNYEYQVKIELEELRVEKGKSDQLRLDLEKQNIFLKQENDTLKTKNANLIQTTTFEEKLATLENFIKQKDDEISHLKLHETSLRQQSESQKTNYQKLLEEWDRERENASALEKKNKHLLERIEEMEFKNNREEISLKRKLEDVKNFEQEQKTTASGETVLKKNIGKMYIRSKNNAIKRLNRRG